MKLIIRSLFLVVFIAMVTVVALALLPGRRIAEIAERQFEAATGRSLEIGGKISPSLFPVLGVRISDVSVANATWAGSEPMLKADGLSVGVHLRPLLTGRVEIDEIRLDAPIVRLAVSKEGQRNWAIVSSPDDGTQSKPDLPPISISFVKLQDAVVIFDDRAAELNYRVEDADFNLELSETNGSARISGEINGLPINANGEATNLGALLGGDVSEFKIHGEIAQSAFVFDGSLDLDPFAIRTSAVVEGGNVDLLARSLAGIALDLPATLISAPKFSGAVTVADDGVLYLRNGYLKAGPNEVAIDADVWPGSSRPRLSARVSSGRLDFSALAGGSGSTPSDPSASGWPKDPIDVSILGHVDAEVRLDLAGLSLGRFDMGRLDATLNLDRSRLVSKIHELNLYGGRISGQSVVNGRGGLSVGGDLRAERLALQPLLTDLADLDRLVAPADFEIKYLAVGNTLHDLMQSLSGEGRLHIGGGEILGVNLPRLRTALGFGEQTTGDRTIIESVDGTFSIDAGVLRNSDMAFTSPVVDGSGTGTIDLGRQFVDYRLIPVVTKRAGEVTVPLNIVGPWSNITIRPNVASLVGQNLDVPLNILENNAKAVLRIKEDEEKARAYQKISTELEAPVETKADAVDALEDKAVRELERGLKRLFD